MLGPMTGPRNTGSLCGPCPNTAYSLVGDSQAIAKTVNAVTG